MIDFYRKCDSEHQYPVLNRLHENLLQEETELMENHSDSLRNSLDIIKSEMNVLNMLEKEKDAMTTREYVRFM